MKAVSFSLFDFIVVSRDLSKGLLPVKWPAETENFRHFSPAFSEGKIPA
jgi:hypothetical protein